MKNAQISFVALFLGMLFLVLGCNREEFSGFTVPSDPGTDIPAELRNLDFYKSSSGVSYLRPTGRDDTDMIREALNNAQPNEIILLRPGVFRIQPIFIADFKGYLVGSGMDKTIIEPFGNMKFPDQDFQEYASEENPLPFLITFRGGRAHLSQMTIRMPANITAFFNAFGNPVDGLGGLVLITGERVSSRAHQVKFEGASGNFPFPGGKNVLNGYYIQGSLGNPNGASGQHKIQSCVFDNVVWGTSVGPVGHIDLTLGGSPQNGNTYTNTFYGIELADISGSRMEISHNTIIDPVSDAIIWEHGIYRTQKQSSQLLFSDNTIEIEGFPTAGFFRDRGKLNGGVSTMKLRYYNNQIKMQDTEWSGLAAIGLDQAYIVQNTLSGTGHAGIFLNAASYGRIIKNKMDQLNTSFASVWLGPGTSENYVAVYENDIVVDQGKDNTIVGTQNQKIKALRGLEEVIQRSMNEYPKALIGKKIKP